MRSTTSSIRISSATMRSLPCGSHASVEGAVTYKALLYVPARAPYDFYSKEYKKGLQLYSNGVLIMENCEDLLPDYFLLRQGHGGFPGPEPEYLP